MRTRSALLIFSAFALAGCSIPQMPAHGELTTLKEHARLDLRAGTETIIEIGSFANATYIEYSLDEREDGKVDACILPANEVEFWNDDKEAHGSGCVVKERSAQRAVVLSPGHYYLGFRCRNVMDTCVLTYDLRYGAPAVGGP